MPGFLQPGAEGTLPPGVNPWQRGLVYLAKREILTAIPPGCQYTIMIGSKQKLVQPASGYHDVFHRAKEIANARISRFAGPVHAWTIAQGWGSLPTAQQIAVAFIALGLKSALPGEDLCRGDADPTAEALATPGGAPSLPVQAYDEVYNAFDFGDTGAVTISYGESVPSCENIDFQPFVQRAERLAEFYASGPLHIIRRSWYSVSNHNLVTVEIHYEL